MAPTTDPDDLVAAARRAAHAGAAQVVPSPQPGLDRVYLPTYGRYFELPSGHWPMSAEQLVAHAESLADDGQLEQAGAAADHALSSSLPGALRSRAHLVHLHVHGVRCCVLHGTHASTHRGCVLR